MVFVTLTQHVGQHYQKTKSNYFMHDDVQIKAQ